MKEVKPKTISVAPDGGWGWAVCFAVALSNILLIPIMQGFGLIFHKKFQEIELSATDIAVIINTNTSFGMILGLVNGSLLKKFGYRKMGILGSLAVAFGVILTAFANSFEYFFVSYGLVTSFGFGLSMASFSLALNSYFRKRLGRATGFAMTGTGLGPVVIPLLISFLLDEYGTTGCVLILGGMSMHSLAAALLLQPLKWHMKTEIPDQELKLLKTSETDGHIDTSIQIGEVHKKPKPEKKNENDIFNSSLSIDHDVETQSIYGFETPLPRRKISVSSAYETGKHKKLTYIRSISQTHPTKQSTLSINSVNSLCSITETDKTEIYDKSYKNEKTVSEKNIKIIEEDPKKKSWMSRLITFLDFDLLKDPVYLNLMIGLSLAVSAEINFSLLTPFILSDFNFKNFEIAKIMSTIAAADIIFRFVAPFISDWLKIKPKLMYMFSMVLLIISRTALIFVTSFTQMIFVAIFLGIAKGFRTVFMSILIPSYVPIEKLASASGMQMVINGVINIIGGPLLGVIRDITGSYSKCIMVINGITALTLIMWTIEYLYIRYIKKDR